MQAVVVVGAKIDGFFFDVGQKFAGQTRHAHFGVSHGRCGVAVDGTEVALAIDDGVAHGEILGHAHQGIVDRLVAVGMVFTNDVTDDAGGLFIRSVKRIGQVVHGVEDAPVHGFESVAHIRDGPTDDDA